MPCLSLRLKVTFVEQEQDGDAVSAGRDQKAVDELDRGRRIERGIDEDREV